MEMSSRALTVKNMCNMVAIYLIAIKSYGQTSTVSGEPGNGILQTFILATATKTLLMPGSESMTFSTPFKCS